MLACLLSYLLTYYLLPYLLTYLLTYSPIACLLASLLTYLPITSLLAYLLYLQTNQTNAKAVNELQTIFLKPKDAELKNTVQTKAGVDGTLTNGMMVTKSNELDAIFGLSVGALDAEIRWALNVAMIHASYRS